MQLSGGVDCDILGAEAKACLQKDWVRLEISYLASRGWAGCLALKVEMHARKDSKTVIEVQYCLGRAAHGVRGMGEEHLEEH